MEATTERVAKALEEAAALYATDSREAASQALVAVLDYLKANGVTDSRRLAPLLHLHTALADADRGVSNDLTKPNPHEGGGKKPLMEIFQWGMAAGLVTVLVERRKMSEPDALKTAAKSIGITPAQLSTYQKNLRRNRCSEEAREQYDFAVQYLRPFVQEDGVTIVAENAAAVIRAMSLQKE